jgi:outer membrane protein TolC
VKTMSFMAGALLCLPVYAQSPATLSYPSVFADAPSGVETGSVDWRQANSQVGTFPRGHADLLRWEQAQTAPAEPVATVEAPLLQADDAVRAALSRHPGQNARTEQAALETRTAWIHAVAAQQSAAYLRDAKEAADAGAELARRMARTGNWSQLEQAREQLFLADARAQLARAGQAAFAAHEKLARQMGTPSSFSLPPRLPDIPTVPSAPQAVEAHLQAAAQGLTPEVAAQLRSHVREAYFAYRSAYDLARLYRDEVVPLRKFIQEEVLLRYSGMLASVWELLAESRQQVLSVNSALEAQRDFWLADAALQAALANPNTPTDQGY